MYDSMSGVSPNRRGGAWQVTYTLLQAYPGAAVLWEC